jgi:hypothetical protein
MIKRLGVARLFVLLAFALAVGLCAAQTTNPTIRLRGTLEAVAPGSLTLKERRGETIVLALAEKLAVNEVFPIELADIKPGSYIGTAAMPQADGTQRSMGVTVFPETSRGVAEGHYPFDLMPQSTMTNATVADVVAAASGRQLQVKYKGGEKTIVVPPGTPIVSFKPGDASLLVPGASVSIAAQEIGGKPTALRINAGRNGFAIPY